MGERMRGERGEGGRRTETEKGGRKEWGREWKDRLREWAITLWLSRGRCTPSVARLPLPQQGPLI